MTLTLGRLSQLDRKEEATKCKWASKILSVSARPIVAGKYDPYPPALQGSGVRMAVRTQPTRPRLPTPSRQRKPDDLTGDDGALVTRLALGIDLPTDEPTPHAIKQRRGAGNE